ncbi:MAG: hypothetical protein V5B40_02550 [Candidatus Accumulibacter meliphilus]|uniref:hypothetical protein n=1 Tax=Candidatus Accumulibacter meliphilus TaxID=2211374 RepID=UPI002FC2C36C
MITHKSELSRCDQDEHLPRVHVDRLSCQRSLDVWQALDEGAQLVGQRWVEAVGIVLAREPRQIVELPLAGLAHPLAGGNHASDGGPGVLAGGGGVGTQGSVSGFAVY